MKDIWVLLITEPNMPVRTHGKKYSSKKAALDDALEISLKHPKWTIKVDVYDPSKIDLNNQNYFFIKRRQYAKNKNKLPTVK
jgi:hypothetical protein